MKRRVGKAIRSAEFWVVALLVLGVGSFFILSWVFHLGWD